MANNQKNQFDKTFNIKRNKHVSSDNVVITKEFTRTIWKDRIIQLLLFIIALLLAATVSFVCFKGPIKTDNGYITPLRGNVKIGQTAIVTNDDDSIATRFLESVAKPDTVIYGQIIAGPYGVLYGDDGNYVIEDGDKKFSSNLKLKKKHEKFLNNEYVIKCTYGDCDKGKDYIVKADKIKGQVTNLK